MSSSVSMPAIGDHRQQQQHLSVNYVAIFHERQDDACAQIHPCKRRRISHDDETGVSDWCPVSQLCSSPSSQTASVCLPPSPPVSPWPPSSPPYPKSLAAAADDLPPKPQVQSTCQLSICRSSVVNLICSSGCLRQFCGSRCYNNHKRDAEDAGQPCIGHKERIPGYDAIEKLTGNFGFDYSAKEGNSSTASIPGIAVQTPSEANGHWDAGAEDWDSPSPVSKNNNEMEETVTVETALAQLDDRKKSVKRRFEIDDSIPVNLMRVRNECLIEGAVLVFQKMFQSRREANRTYFDVRSRTIFWTVELVFETEGVFATVLLNNVSEKMTVYDLLCFVAQPESGCRLPLALAHRFANKTLDQLTIFHANGIGLTEVKPEMTIAEANQTHLQILEFPTILLKPADEDSTVMYQIESFQ